MRHAEPARDARLAGMLHDLARLYSARDLLAQCEARGMAIDAYERAFPIVLHARLGAELAAERYGVTSPAIRSAIAKHTLAAEQMSRLDCILYLADSLEPAREFADRARIAALAYEDLDAGMQAALASAFRYLQEKGLEPAPQTLLAAQRFGVSVTR